MTAPQSAEYSLQLLVNNGISIKALPATITVVPTPLRGTYADAPTASITTGGSAQTLFAAAAERLALFVENLSSGDLWVRFGATATQAAPSIRLPAGAILNMDARGFIDTGLVSIIGATTGQAFTAKAA